jgi:hypothetical protein
VIHSLPDTAIFIGFLKDVGENELVRLFQNITSYKLKYNNTTWRYYCVWACRRYYFKIMELRGYYHYEFILADNCWVTYTGSAILQATHHVADSCLLKLSLTHEFILADNCWITHTAYAIWHANHRVADNDLLKWSLMHNIS